VNCETTRDVIHEALDTDRVESLADDVRQHVASCEGCRDLLDELTALRSALHGLPREPLPSSTLDAIWRQTVRSNRDTRGRIRGGWRAAAAAVLVTAVGASTLYFVSKPTVAPGPSAADLARAQAEAELVFGYTARALAATRDAAARDVIKEKVSPAVRGAAAPHSPRSSS